MKGEFSNPTLVQIRKLRFRGQEVYSGYAQGAVTE